MAATTSIPQVIFTSLKSVLFYLFLLSLTLTYAESARFLSEEEDTADAALPAAAAAPAPIAAAAPPPVPGPDSPALSFYMHDILGGSAPSGRVVAGLTANTRINNLPFSKPNGGVFPLTGGVPLMTANNRGRPNNFNGILNNNNFPFMVGPGGATTSTVINNNGNNNVFMNGKGLPFVTAGQLPAVSTLQNLLFGTITVIDDEITKGHEIGASVIGKAQGFHLASSLDGSSQTMAFTVMLGNDGSEDYEDTISFFGVHRTATADKSLIAIVGGTGKYDDAKGYTTVETIHLPDQHMTDGVERLLQFNTFLTQ